MNMPKRLADGIAAIGVEYRDDPAPSIRGRFYYQGQPLKTLWSSAAAADLKAFHGLNAEEELIDIILSEIKAAIGLQPL